MLDVVVELLRKLEFSGSEEGGGNFEWGIVCLKSVCVVNKFKDEIYVLVFGKVRLLIRMKLF